MKTKTFLAFTLALGGMLTAQAAGPDTWVAVDALGRNVASADSGASTQNVDKNVQMGMFYYIWHGHHGTEIKDLTRLIAENPKNPKFGDYGQFHWGGKPLLGYYRGGDEYVIAKHMQWLVEAGMDYYFFDVTNGYTYLDAVRKVMKEIDRRQALGLKTPKLAFMTSAGSDRVVKQLYDSLYTKPEYDKYWYLYNGKPLIFANEEAQKKYKNNKIGKRFTMRHSWAWMDMSKPGKWPWLEVYPQPAGWSYDDKGNKVTEQITVSVAQHPSSNRGKSWHDGVQPEIDEYALCKETPYGLHFQQQWDRALEVHAPNVMITQWNEWMAQRFKAGKGEESIVRPGGPKVVGETFFVDVYNQEYNRDIEPSSEPLILDNYYLQLVSNVRKYRGVEAIPVPTVAKKINVNGSLSQWDDVDAVFSDEPGDTYYTSATAQPAATLNRKSNDIVSLKVTKDDSKLYFLATCADDILSQHTYYGTQWMTLLLNTDCNYTTGWNGYDYITVCNGATMQLKRYDGNTWVDCGNLNWKLNGKNLVIEVPRKLLGMQADSDFDFKMVDNVQSTDKWSVLDFYRDGESAPTGRFNYRYKGSHLTTK